MPLYGLADAQIDAQENATRRIGDIGQTYQAMKNSGAITRAFIQSTMNQMQQVINDYAHQWSNTKRGEAGRVTLQNFYDSAMRPALVSDFNSASTDSQQIPVSPVSIPNLVSSPTMQPYNPAINYNIEINPGSTPSAETAGNLQPSQSPGAPTGAGINIPGTEQTVTATLPTNPIVYVLGGLILMALFAAKRQNS